MREIKFRAFDKETNKMCDVLMIDWRDSTAFIFYDNKSDWEKTRERWGAERDLERLVLVQFTGLKDKNGKEIYEGDIVTAWRPRPKHLPKDPFKKIQVIGNVVYEPPSFFLITAIYDDRNWIELEHNAEPYEIIGNIYENPELLNK